MKKILILVLALLVLAVTVTGDVGVVNAIGTDASVKNDVPKYVGDAYGDELLSDAVEFLPRYSRGKTVPEDDELFSHMMFYQLDDDGSGAAMFHLFGCNSMDHCNVVALFTSDGGNTWNGYIADRENGPITAVFLDGKLILFSVGTASEAMTVEVLGPEQDIYSNARRLASLPGWTGEEIKGNFDARVLYKDLLNNTVTVGWYEPCENLLMKSGCFLVTEYNCEFDTVKVLFRDDSIIDAVYDLSYYSTLIY